MNKYHLILKIFYSRSDSFPGVAFRAEISIMINNKISFFHWTTITFSYNEVEIIISNREAAFVVFMEGRVFVIDLTSWAHSKINGSRKFHSNSHFIINRVCCSYRPSYQNVFLTIIQDVRDSDYWWKNKWSWARHGSSKGSKTDQSSYLKQKEKYRNKTYEYQILPVFSE